MKLNYRFVALFFSCMAFGIYFWVIQPLQSFHPLNKINISRVYGDSNRYQVILTREKTHTRLIDDGEKLSQIIEGDVKLEKEVNGKLFIYGYRGYTIIDLRTNQIRQYVVTWGPSVAGSGGTDLDVFKKVYGNKYCSLSSIAEFSEEEQTIFQNMEEHTDKAYLSQFFLEKKLKMVNIPLYNENRLMEMGTQTLLEPHVIAYEESEEKMYFYGKYSLILIEKDPYQIYQLVSKPKMNEEGFSQYSTNDKASKLQLNFYHALNNIENFSVEDRQIFEVLKTKTD